MNAKTNTKHTQVAIRNIVERALEGHLEVAREQCIDSARLTEDLKADSLDVIEVVLALEEEFSIEIPDEAVEKIKTVGDIIAYVEKHGAVAVTVPVR
jgi:acyl carrier protein